MTSPCFKVTVRVSGTLQAPIFQVWSYVKTFGRAEAWSGYFNGTKVLTALLPGQAEGKIGAVRTTAIGDASYVEQLEALDIDDYILKYKIVDHPKNTNPFPGSLFNFKATIKLQEITRTNETLMEWIGQFDTTPQEAVIMRRAVEDLFEGGFVGLETLLLPVSTFPAEATARQHPMVHGQRLSDMSRNLGSMNLRSGGPAIGLDSSAQGSGFQHQRSYMGPASVVSEPPPPTPHLQGVTESESVSSLESSPHMMDRPPGGFHHQWTSGGSGHVLSQMPKRLSAEQDLIAKRQLQRHRSSRKEEPRAIDPTNPYFGHPVQGSRHSASSIESIPINQAAEQGRAEVPRRDLSVGTSVMEPPSQDADPDYDPVLQDREDFKASLLKNNMVPNNNFQGSEAGQRGRRTSDRLRMERQPIERIPEQYDAEDVNNYSAGNSNLPSPQNPNDEVFDNLEWARRQQQREMEAREAFQRKQTRMGVFSQSAVPGGPFAVASKAPRAPSMLQRHASQQSLESLGELPSNFSGEPRRSNQNTPKLGRQEQEQGQWPS